MEGYPRPFACQGLGLSVTPPVNVVTVIGSGSSLVWTFDSDPIALGSIDQGSGFKGRQPPGSFINGTSWELDGNALLIHYSAPFWEEGDEFSTESGGVLTGVTFANGGIVAETSGTIIT